jgi:hypothetical protein
MNAILASTLRKGDAISHPECGQCAGLRLSDESLSPTQKRYLPPRVEWMGVCEAESLPGRKDRAARAEAGEQMPVGSIQKSPPFFPYVQKRTARRPRTFPLNDFQANDTRSDNGRQRMSRIAATRFVYSGDA